MFDLKRVHLVFTVFVLMGMAPLRHSFAEGAALLNREEMNSVFGQPQLRTEVLHITERVLKFYPPERYHYIFIGRSLAMIKAAMDSLGHSNTGLPFRGKSFDLSFSAANAQEVAALLRVHLDEHLPKESERQGKELVLLDFTLSASGLLTAQKVLDWYYQGRERLNLLRVTTNPLSLSSITPAFLNKHHDKSIRISQESRFAMHLLNSNFDSYAGYGTFNISNGHYLEYERSTSARYESLKDWVSTEILGLSPRRHRCVGYLSTTSL